MCGMNQLSVTTTMNMTPLSWQASPPSPKALAEGSTWDRLKATVRRLGVAVRPVPESTDRIASWPLNASMSSVPKARRLARARLTAWGLEGMSDVVELLVSELVTNALQHAPGPYRLTISAQDGLLRCEVEDAGSVLPQAHPAREYDEGGRGLHLLDLLACCWGSAHTHTGKAMWFELPTRAPAED
jgi:hypothetical protein